MQSQNRSIIVLILIVVTSVVLSPALNNDFTNWDDNKYVLGNELIQEISVSNVEAIFTSFFMGNYHPITMLSYMFDYALFGADPMGFHLVSLLLHILNALLVFYIVLDLGKRGIDVSGEKMLWAAGLVALIFGIHPLHVEPVAWISGRKELLFTLFYLLAIRSYLKHVSKENDVSSLIWAFVFFGLSCLSKAVAVTLPVVLVALDFLIKRAQNKWTYLEKVPFVILSLIIGLVAINAQNQFEAVDIVDKSVWDHLIIGIYALGSYVQKFVAPINLSCFYPYPEAIDGVYPLMMYLLPTIVLATVSTIVWMSKFRRVMVFSLAFFFVTILPVLQFVPVGEAFMADRYTYLPYFGLSLMVGYGLLHMMEVAAKRIKYLRVVGPIALGIFLLFCSMQSWKRAEVWRTSEALWDDVIDQYNNVWIAYNNRGLTLMNAGNFEYAILNFSQALGLKSDLPRIYQNRAYAYFRNEEYDKAFGDSDHAIELDSSKAESYANRGSLYHDYGALDQALVDYNVAINMNPRLELTFLNRGKLHLRKGNMELALADFNQVLGLNPKSLEGLGNRAYIYLTIGRFDYSVRDYTEVIDLNPLLGNAFNNRGVAYYNLGMFQEAIEDLDRAKNLGHTIDVNLYQDLKSRLN